MPAIVADVAGNMNTLPLAPAFIVCALFTVMAEPALKYIPPVPFVADNVPTPETVSDPGELIVRLPLMFVVAIVPVLLRTPPAIVMLRLVAEVNVPAFVKVVMPLKVQPLAHETVELA